MPIRESLRERCIRMLLAGVALCSLPALLGIMVFLFAEGLPLFAHYKPTDFFFGLLWYPTAEPPDFGIFPLIAGSLSVTLLSACIAVPLGVLTAAYLTEIAADGVRRIVKPFVELLAALPSVVIGFFGMVVVAPLLQESFELATGLNM
ncbi:MAG: phosphate ABC transporter permease subunit PstC, partial [Deltaproteobacteria bacterium]|nr:phosphate ABC transporter permease subunit PstC [Deltaproteobacteria bacterium]